MYSLRKTQNHYVLEPNINVAIDLGKAGIFCIPVCENSNIQRLAENFAIDHKLNEEAKLAIVNLLKNQLGQAEGKSRKENKASRSNTIQNTQPNQIPYSKFKEKLSKNPSQKYTRRKSVTPLKLAKCNTEESHLTKQLSSRAVIKTVDLVSSQQQNRQLQELFCFLNRKSRSKKKIDIDSICFEGFHQKLLQILHKFFSCLTEEQIEDLTLDAFKSLAKKHGLAASISRMFRITPFLTD